VCRDKKKGDSVPTYPYHMPETKFPPLYVWPTKPDWTRNNIFSGTCMWDCATIPLSDWSVRHFCVCTPIISPQAHPEHHL